MKLYIFLLSVFLSSLSAQTVYVDINNTTPGDGSSWEVAYTNLNDALLGAPAGAEVWIAAGTYVTPDTASFYINKELTVLGGFAGTETTVDAADPDANPTILSGDVMGNDGEAGFDSTLYVDNNRVLFVTDTSEESAYTVTLDGFSIVHGAISTEIGDFNADAGGGLSSYAKLKASRLKFSRNYARAGAALFVRFPSTDGSTFEDIEVSGNFTAGQRTVYIRDNNNVEFKNSSFVGEGTGTAANSGMFRGFNTVGFTIRDCDFTDIWSASTGGGIAISLSDSTLVENCTFNNVRTDGWGGGITSYNTNLTILSSTFGQNQSGRNGGAIDYEVGDGGNFSINLQGNIFNESAGSLGGALFLFGPEGSVFEANIDDCTFTNNVTTAGGSGAVVYASGYNTPITLTNSLLEGNVSQGGAFTSNTNGSLTIRNTQFIENGNTSEAGRGALTAYMVAGEPLIIDSCLFENNQISALPDYFSAGAAAYLYGGNLTSTPLTITNTQFVNNAASGDTPGGAIFTTRAWDVTMNNCNFDGNVAGAIGGAIYSRVFENQRDTSGMGEITVTFQPFTGSISNSRFTNNLSASQGGAIGNFRTAYDLTNSIFANNTVGPEGASGGAIMMYGPSQFPDDMGDLAFTGEIALSSTMINNTFVDNRKGGGEGAAGNDIALFQEGSSAGLNGGSIAVTLLNNAFLQSEQGESVAIETGRELESITPVGTITATSLGGNFYNNTTDERLGLIDASDMVDLAVVNVSDLFVDLFDDADEGINLQLVVPAFLEDNPLINNAIVNNLVPATDIVGNPRGNAPDIGAYEADQASVSTGEPLANSGLDISFFPNPTKDFLNIRNDEASIERFNLLVSDQNGRVLKARQFNGATNSVDLSTVPAGVYNLQLVVNGKIYGQQIIKQ